MEETHSRESFTAFFASSLGEDVAREVIVRTALGMGMDSRRFTNASAHRVCERLALEPGIIGIAARFAKSRLILKWGVPKSGL
jgi:hypothetical protein